jgi:hypothetical protein
MNKSFCIYGLCLLIEEINEIINCNEQKYDDIEEEAKNFGLDIYFLDDYCFIGLEWEAIADNETGLEFKSRVKSLIYQFFEQEYIGFDTYKEIWND